MIDCPAGGPEAQLTKSSCGVDATLVEPSSISTLCRYDSRTHELIFADREGDPSCKSYKAGYDKELLEQTSCMGRTDCSLCLRNVSACVPYQPDPSSCTIAALCAAKKADCLRFEDAASPDNCGGPNQDAPQLSRGCGRTRIHSVAHDVGRDEVLEFQFDSSTHELVGVTDTRTEPATYPECLGVWGDVAAPCADEMTCTLCWQAQDACTAAQIADR
jgi:hypothetical protein